MLFYRLPHPGGELWLAFARNHLFGVWRGPDDARHDNPSSHAWQLGEYWESSPERRGDCIFYSRFSAIETHIANLYWIW